MTMLYWLGILLCLSQSALLSGLNLALFSLSMLELRVEAKQNNRMAKQALRLRENANFALVTMLWGNVGVNVLLALLSGSVLSGVGAFIFSTVAITILAEIIPQAYFSRHALRVVGALSPVLRIYQTVLYPIARPTAWVLDTWLGRDNIRYFREKDLRQVIQLHMDATDTEIARIEGQGALNFLAIDDVSLADEGEAIDPDSVVQLPFHDSDPVFPPIAATTDDEFLRTLNRSGKTWAIIVDAHDEPRLVLMVDDFIREALFAPNVFNPRRHCHRPIVVRDTGRKLGDLIQSFQVRPEKPGDDIVDDDVIMLWGPERRIVTGTDILGRLLRGIAGRVEKRPQCTAE